MSDGLAMVEGEEAARMLAAPLPWNADEDDTLVCRQVRDETHDVKTFVLSAPSPRRFAFEPGQFLTFAFPIGGETVHRCYTIASAPTRPDTVAITVKRVPSGPVSNWLHDTLRPGGSVRALGPMGDFSCFRHPAAKYLFVSGGSGITPLMAMARTFGDLALPRDIAFVHAARSPADIVFRDELALMARQQPSFRLATLVERDSAGEAWSGHRGRLSAAFLELAVPDFRERETFVCGPAPFMTTARIILEGAGYDMRRHHAESFDFAALTGAERADAVVAEAVLDAPPIEVKSYAVEFAKTRRSIQVRADQTVLDAARKQGIRLPSSCTRGVCGTCKSRIAAGTVTMAHGGGIRQREIDAGLALLCCAKPTSDLVVER